MGEILLTEECGKEAFFFILGIIYSESLNSGVFVLNECSSALK